MGFEVDLPKQNNSTQSELTVRMDALAGFVVGQIRTMTDVQRTIPITVIWRCYLDTSYPRLPLLDPLSFIVIDVAATRLAVEIRCAATLLPNIAAGTRYTMDKFPTLAYLCEPQPKAIRSSCLACRTSWARRIRRAASIAGA